MRFFLTSSLVGTKSMSFVLAGFFKIFKGQDITIPAVNTGMDLVNPICACLNNFTLEQKEKADAVAGGDFSKILIELQIIRASFSAEKSDSKKGGLPEFKRPQDILNVFFSEEGSPQKVHTLPKITIAI